MNISKMPRQPNVADLSAHMAHFISADYTQRLHLPVIQFAVVISIPMPVFRAVQR